MQKFIPILLASLLLALSACATMPTPTPEINSASAATQIAEIVSQELTAAVPPQATATSTPSSTPELNTTYENAVSVEMQLLLGIFKLEGTENELTQEQAQTLLPLWTDFKNLSQDLGPVRGEPGQAQGQPGSTPQAPEIDPEVQAQIEPLVKQILSALTPEQIRAISELRITPETAQTLLQAQGITLGGPQANGAGHGGQTPQGTPPSGDPGGGAQQPENGQMPSPQAGGTPGGMRFLPPELIEALIKLLQNKAG